MKRRVGSKTLKLELKFGIINSQKRMLKKQEESLSKFWRIELPTTGPPLFAEQNLF